MMKRGVAIISPALDDLEKERLLLEDQMFHNHDKYKKGLAFDLWGSFDLVFQLNNFMTNYLEKQ